MQYKDLCPDRKDYYSQKNNKLDPSISCQVTAAIQCLDIIGEAKNIKGPCIQPEDSLRWLCEQPRATAFGEVYYGENWLDKVDHPSEWAGVLEHEINAELDYTAVQFKSRLLNSKIASSVIDGLPVQACLSFPGISGHYVSVVGITPDNKFIINDPYKDFFNGKDDGYHVEVSEDEWAKHYKGYGFIYNRRNA